jgi:hypothetical protein
VIDADNEQSRTNDDNDSSEHENKSDHAPHNDERGQSKAPNNNEGGETKSPDNEEADDDDLSEASTSASAFVPGSEEDEEEVPYTPGHTHLPIPELLDALGEPQFLQPRKSPRRSPRHAQPPKPPTPDNTSKFTESDAATDLGTTDDARTVAVPWMLYLPHPIPAIRVDPTAAVTQSQDVANAADASPQAVLERLAQLPGMLTATAPVGAARPLVLDKLAARNQARAKASQEKE